MSDKKKKNVQPVEEQTQEKEPETVSELESEQIPEESETVSLPFEISDKMRAKARVMGFPLEQLLQWAASVEVRFQILAKTVAHNPQETVRLLTAEARKAERQRVLGGEAKTASGQGGGKEDLKMVLSMLGGGGGGYDEEMSGLMKDMFRLNMDKMKQDMTNSMLSAQADADLSKTLKEALSKEFAKKTAAKLMDTG